MVGPLTDSTTRDGTYEQGLRERSPASLMGYAAANRAIKQAFRLRSEVRAAQWKRKSRAGTQGTQRRPGPPAMVPTRKPKRTMSRRRQGRGATDKSNNHPLRAPKGGANPGESRARGDKGCDFEFPGYGSGNVLPEPMIASRTSRQTFLGLPPPCRQRRESMLVRDQARPHCTAAASSKAGTERSTHPWQCRAESYLQAVRPKTLEKNTMTSGGRFVKRRKFLRHSCSTTAGPHNQGVDPSRDHESWR